MIWIEPEAGVWPFGGFPPVVQLGGRVYRRTWWEWPWSEAVAQYRETRPHDAAHLKVYENGVWVVDHLDESNPDYSAVEHVIDDLVPDEDKAMLLLGLLTP